MKRILWSCALAGAVFATAAQAAGNAGYDLSTGVYTDYVYRGTLRAQTSLLSEATATWKTTRTLSLNARVVNATVLSTNPLPGKVGPGTSGLLEDRYDLSARYKPFKNVGFTAGWMYYDWNKARPVAPDTAEVYGGIETNWCGWHPSAYVFYDYSKQIGLYTAATVARSFAVGKTGWSLDTFGAIGFDFGNRSGNAPKINGLRNGLVSFDMNYTLTKGVEFGPRVDIDFPARRALDPNDGPEHIRVVPGLGFNCNGTF
jgi:hypothetical protein